MEGIWKIFEDILGRFLEGNLSSFMGNVTYTNLYENENLIKSLQHFNEIIILTACGLMPPALSPVDLGFLCSAV